MAKADDSPFEGWLDDLSLEAWLDVSLLDTLFVVSFVVMFEPATVA